MSTTGILILVKLRRKFAHNRSIMLFPHELIIQILLWLPVKSLVRFKCVCKLWFSLISHDSDFANLHFQLNSATHTHTRRILFLPNSHFRLNSPTHEALSIDFEAWPNLANSVSLNLDSIFPEDFKGFEIRGSCRGFILFCSSLNIYLWNPSTGIQKQIPLSPFGSYSYAKCFYGFGYDESTDDYLVVSLSRHVVVSLSPHAVHDPLLRLEYFSLKANKWKEVEGPYSPYTFQDGEAKGGCLYKGAIHWRAYLYDLQTDVILAFDLMERKLSYMLWPTGFCGNPLESGLWVFGEFLSVYAWNYSNDTFEICVMKDYKVNSSWTTTLVLSVDFFFPLCCTKMGDIIGTDGEDGLVKYHKSGQCLEVHSYPNSHLSRLTVYIDSLLSLPSDGDNQQA